MTQTQVVGIRDGRIARDFGLMTEVEAEEFCQRRAGLDGLDICPVDDDCILDVGDQVSVDADGVATLVE